MGFNIGDVVQLVSGGPEMTVAALDRSSVIGRGVEVTWFERGRLRREWLPRKALKVAGSDAPRPEA